MFVKGVIGSFSLPKQQTYKEGYLLPVMDAESLLETGRHQAVLQQLRNTCDLPEAHYEALYLSVIHRFVEFVQVLPMHFDGPLCSVMNESLCYAMTALNKYQIVHASDSNPLKFYAVFTAALFRNISSVVLNQRVLLTKESGDFIDYWNPFDGAITQQADYYRLIRLAPIYQRLDRTLRHVLAYQLMPKQGYQWIASDFRLLADWLDAIDDDQGEGGALGHILNLVKYEDVVALQSSLQQISIKQRKSSTTEHGLSFYRWLRNVIGQQLEVNQAGKGLYITNEGLFIERDKLFKEFMETYNAPVSLSVVYMQFGNLMGIVKKSGYDFMNAQYFSDSIESLETGKKAFGSLISSRSSSLHDGMVLADPAMLLNSASIPATTPLLRSMQSKHIVPVDLPRLDSIPKNIKPNLDKSR